MITLSQGSTTASAMRGGSTADEHYQALAQWILSARGVAGECRTIGITSCAPGAGVSTVAASLAVAAARTCDRPALLLDLSPGRSPAAARWSLRKELGLRAALSSTAAPSECAQATPIRNLSVLARETGVSGEQLDTTGVLDLLRELEQTFGFIVVDLPPTDSGLCFATAGTMNGVLLVMESHRTLGESAARAKQRLIHANAAVLGIILNKYSRDVPRWLQA
jgi:Mrp family chromosome partitioning ATPase